MLPELHQEFFAPHVHSAFQAVPDGGEPFELELIGVVGRLRTPQQEAFSLLFHGPADPFLPQGTVRLRHARLGELDIFLVPVARDGDGYQYEAVFNHLIDGKPRLEKTHE